MDVPIAKDGTPLSDGLSALSCDILYKNWPIFKAYWIILIFRNPPSSFFLRAKLQTNLFIHVYKKTK